MTWPWPDHVLTLTLTLTRPWVGLRVGPWAWQYSQIPNHQKEKFLFLANFLAYSVKIGSSYLSAKFHKIVPCDCWLWCVSPPCSMRSDNPSLREINMTPWLPPSSWEKQPINPYIGHWIYSRIKIILNSKRELDLKAIGSNHGVKWKFIWAQRLYI